TNALQPQNIFHFDAFVSYNHKDKNWVKDVLLPSLEHEGLHLCIDYRDFDIGVPSVTNMENAVRRSRKTLLILTPNWIVSEWTAFESLLIQTQDPTNLHRRILPILVQPSVLPPRLQIFTYLDLTKSVEFDRQMLRLIEAIRASQL
ncbi:MAG TPA: toll/interleukin-1 receptor domain-containing protein, partial [Methylomirabilota bacterium]|nr:toll/interleukin-1 receptor domain-containing protein [Methylomirabilota bacterium]